MLSVSFIHGSLFIATPDKPYAMCLRISVDAMIVDLDTRNVMDIGPVKVLLMIDCHGNSGKKNRERKES